MKSIKPNDKSAPKHIPDSHRVKSHRDRHSGDGLGIPSQGGVALAPPVIFRAPLGKTGTPEGK